MARLLPHAGALSPFLRRQLGPGGAEGLELGGWSEGMKSNASWSGTRPEQGWVGNPGQRMNKSRQPGKQRFPPQGWTEAPDGDVLST